MFLFIIIAEQLGWTGKVGHFIGVIVVLSCDLGKPQHM